MYEVGSIKEPYQLLNRLPKDYKFTEHEQYAIERIQGLHRLQNNLPFYAWNPAKTFLQAC